MLKPGAMLSGSHGTVLAMCRRNVVSNAPAPFPQSSEPSDSIASRANASPELPTMIECSDDSSVYALISDAFRAC